MTFNSGHLVPGVITRVTTQRSSSSVLGANPPLLIGGRTSAGTVAAGVLTAVTSASAARAQFGARSMLASMIAAYRQIDPNGTLYAIGVDDDGSGVPEVRTLTFSGTATEAGTVALYIGGQRITASVASGAAAATVAASVEAAWDLVTTLPFTASVSGAVVTITAAQDGPSHSEVDIRHSYQSGEKLPAGITLAYATTTAGATAPSIATAITTMGDVGFDYVGFGYSDTTAVGLMETEFGHTSGRWAPLRQQYGWAVTAKIDSSSNLITYGGSRNAAHVGVIGVASSPTTPWAVVGQALATARLSLDEHPCRPFTGLELPGILPPASGDAFGEATRQALMAAGIATTYTEGGVVRMDRLPMTYKTDANGDADDSWRDVQSSATMGRTLRQIVADHRSTFSRAVLVDDDTPVGAAARNVVWPKLIAGRAVTTYRNLQALGWLEGADEFAALVAATRDETDAGRVNIYAPIDVANPYWIGAIDAVLLLNY